MTKKELVRKVKRLLSKNKTEEALKLLSKAQLSENDKTVVILMGQMARLQQDSLINKITNEEKHRTQNSINESILDLAENIDPEEVKLEELLLDKEKGEKGDQAIIMSAFPDDKLDSFRMSKKYLLLLLLIIPLAYLVFRNRTAQPINEQHTSNQESSISYGQNIENPNSIWTETASLYFEDFTNRHHPNFKKLVWTLEANSKDFWTGVENDEYYAIKIKSDQPISRHKYIGGLDYDANKDMIAYSAKIKLPKDLDCRSQNGCLGRGITINYNKSNKSAYSFTINDDGQIKFIKLFNFKNPSKGEELFSRQIDLDEHQKSIELGLGKVNNKYFLFVNKELITEIEIHEPLQGRYCGIIAAGNGNHFFDEVTIRKQ